MQQPPVSPDMSSHHIIPGPVLSPDRPHHQLGVHHLEAVPHPQAAPRAQTDGRLEAGVWLPVLLTPRQLPGLPQPRPHTVRLTHRDVALLPQPLSLRDPRAALVEAEWPASPVLAAGQRPAAVPLEVSLGVSPVPLQLIPGQAAVAGLGGVLVAGVAVLQAPGHVGVRGVGDLHAVVVELVTGVLL